MTAEERAKAEEEEQKVVEYQIRMRQEEKERDEEREKERAIERARRMSEPSAPTSQEGEVGTPVDPAPPPSQLSSAPAGSLGPLAASDSQPAAPRPEGQRGHHREGSSRRERSRRHTTTTEGGQERQRATTQQEHLRRHGVNLEGWEDGPELDIEEMMVMEAIRRSLAENAQSSSQPVPDPSTHARSPCSCDNAGPVVEGRTDPV